MSDLDDGIAAFRAGDKQKARALLVQSTKDEPNNERAWMWLYNVSENEREKQFCLKQILKLNPKNQKAQQLLRGIKPKSKRNPLLIGLAFLVSFLLVCCVVPGMASLLSKPQPAARSVDDYIREYGGNRDVYQKLATLESCQLLQTEFESASDNNARYPAGSPNAKMALGYMTAADERMKTIGCYENPQKPAKTLPGSGALSSPPETATSFTVTRLPEPTHSQKIRPTWTYEPTLTAIKIIKNTQPSSNSQGCSCAADLYNCDDFGTHAKAQACYQHCVSLGAGDVHRLDRENDGLACENLP